METRIERLCGMAGMRMTGQRPRILRTMPNSAGAAPLL